jgi:hypothetical protein
VLFDRRLVFFGCHPSPQAEDLLSVVVFARSFICHSAAEESAVAVGLAFALAFAFLICHSQRESAFKLHPGTNNRVPTAFAILKGWEQSSPNQDAFSHVQRRKKKPKKNAVISTGP